MPSSPSVERVRDSRLLIFSQRNLSRHAWLSGQYEFEDLLLGWEDASLLAPQPLDHQYVRTVARRAANAAVRRAGLPRQGPLLPAPSAQRTRVTTQHDLFLAVIQQPHELSYLHRLDGWRRSSRLAACILLEVWSPKIAGDADYLRALRDFDRVYVINADVVEPLGDLVGRRPVYLPIAVDTARLAPVPRAPVRFIDVHSYGRRSPHVHRALLELAEREGLTYFFDTLGDAAFRDHQEHRLQLASVLQRSRYVMTHTINDSPERRSYTGGDDTLSPRYFEAAAAGAVLLGSRPEGALTDELLAWPRAVVPLPYTSTEVRPVLEELEADREGTARLRADNVRESLLRHDWAYRWRAVLDDLGLSPAAGLQRRVEHLHELAAAVPEHGWPTGPRS